MLDLLFSGIGPLFSVPALVGTGFFVLRLVLMSVGAVGLDAGHGDIGADVSADGLDAHHGDAGDAFKVLSVQAVTAFGMGFGWGGLAAMHGTDWPFGLVVGAAVASGVAMMWLLGALLRAAYDLQASGNVAIGSAAGSQGEVYVGVPEAGTGKGRVTVVIGDKQRTFDAVTLGDPIPSRARVRVVGVNEDNSLTVEPA